MTDRNRCASCSAPVIWAQTVAGRRMPVDPHTDPNGNVLLDYGTNPPTAHVVRPGSPGARVSHFAVCPAADHHRQPRPRPTPEPTLFDERTTP